MMIAMFAWRRHLPWLLALAAVALTGGVALLLTA